MAKGKVSFDYDGTLTLKEVQEYAKELVKKGLEVYVCTMRYSDQHQHMWIDNGYPIYWFEQGNTELYKVIDEIGIKRENIIFCEMKEKSSFLKEIDPIWHLDDDETVFEEILFNSTVTPVYVKEDNWEAYCDDLIKIYTM